MRRLIFLCLVLLSTCLACRSLPKEHYYPFHYRFNQAFRHDTLLVVLKNPLLCPVSVSLAGDSTNVELQKLFGRVLLSSQQDTTIKIVYIGDSSVVNKKIRYRIQYAGFNRPLLKLPIAYPFPARRTYKVIQGYHGRFSHYKPQNEFAIDFNLRVGDTITCVDNGVVVGVIDGYSRHGTSKVWRTNDRANYLTIYHPVSGLYSQYVHLQFRGALVKLGEQVGKGQPIGLSGMTGFTTTPHLHFSMKYPTEQGSLLSIAVPFENRMPKKPSGASPK